MAKVIVRGAIVDDRWTLLRFPEKNEPVRKQAGKVVIYRVTGEQAASAEDVAALAVPSGKVIVPLLLWLARREELAARFAAGEIAVWLESFESPESLAESVDDINRLPLIAVNFPRFQDGRGFSFATLLRSRYGYRGELRAVGDVFRDTLYYLKRCGFDAFAVRADKNIEDALRGLSDFSETYQSTVDQALPLYRRYARSPA